MIVPNDNELESIYLVGFLSYKHVTFRYFSTSDLSFTVPVKKLTPVASIFIFNLKNKLLFLMHNHKNTKFNKILFQNLKSIIPLYFENKSLFKCDSGLYKSLISFIYYCFF